jgi:hypothetical protein
LGSEIKLLHALRKDTPPMPAETPIAEPKHPLHALTTYELRDYRRDLELAIAFFDRQTRVPPARDRLQATLDDVIAEQDDRTRLATHA